jgi:hypothetical protein
MGKKYLNSRNIELVASYFAHSFNSNHAAKFALEEWFLSEPLSIKNSNARFEVHFMATTNLCRYYDFGVGYKLIGYTMNSTLVTFYQDYILENYPAIKKYIYEEMEVILKMYMCTSPTQLLNDVIMEAAPYTYDINNVIDEIFENYILKSDYRDKNDRFYEKFPINWLNEANYNFMLKPIKNINE